MNKEQVEAKKEEMLEEVAKTMYEFGADKRYWNWSTAQEKDKAWFRKEAKAICSLFEQPCMKLRDDTELTPEISDEAKYGGFYLCGNCQHPVRNYEACHNCNPDESLLLSDEEIKQVQIDGETKSVCEAFCKNDVLYTSRQVAKAQLAHCEPLIRTEYDKEKAEFGLSVHEAAIAMTLKEVGKWMEQGDIACCDEYQMIYVEPDYIKRLKKGEMPQ